LYWRGNNETIYEDTFKTFIVSCEELTGVIIVTYGASQNQDILDYVCFSLPFYNIFKVLGLAS